jgi:DNA polymerase-1
MAGDQTDGYAGVPGIGVKRAAVLLDAEGYTWDTVLQAFLDKGLTEEDALRNARLAKILQSEDYDNELQQPKLWTPTSSD